ncbi:hypothetical protein SBOR_5974 [Sclerotinia borealis F-4128]|uniref:Uncharacterized protein n=1 Tax=Sclerotinia borealis (strain F-4128) TaxID=1432307 RepID=W9CFX4_SCLBF|nr:hypothetical protein SBOR_5974 [Sclerotinia borealis F-4128]
MSGKQLTTGIESTPSKATPKVTPPGMENSASDHEDTTSHENLPSIPKLRDDIEMSDAHLNATITYLCRMVYPNDGDKLHTPSSILDQFLNVFSEICADENGILPFQLANLEMLEIRLREGLEAIREKKGELWVGLNGSGYPQEYFDDVVDYCHGGIESDESDDDYCCHCDADSAALLVDRGVSWCHRCVGMEHGDPVEDDDSCYRYAVYNEDPDDDDEHYCQCVPESENDLHSHCASEHKAAEDNEDTINASRSSTLSLT